MRTNYAKGCDVTGDSRVEMRPAFERPPSGLAACLRKSTIRRGAIGEGHFSSDYRSDQTLAASPAKPGPSRSTNRKVHMKNMLKISTLTLFVVLAFTACGQPKPPPPLTYKSSGKVNYTLTSEEKLRLDTIQQKTFLFFLNEHHPEWGIVKDRTAVWAPASIASTGFGIPCFAIGVERKWITREQAAQITLNTLNFFYNSVQSAGTNATGYKGFYYHFLAMDTGTRTWKCELSSVDTGLLAMGIIFARNYYQQDNEVETRIRLLAGKLLGRIEWNFMTMPPAGRIRQHDLHGLDARKGVARYGLERLQRSTVPLYPGGGQRDGECQTKLPGLAKIV